MKYISKKRYQTADDAIAVDSLKEPAHGTVSESVSRSGTRPDFASVTVVTPEIYVKKETAGARAVIADSSFDDFLFKDEYIRFKKDCEEPSSVTKNVKKTKDRNVSIEFSLNDGSTTIKSEKKPAASSKIPALIPTLLLYCASFLIIGLLVYGTYTQINLRLRLGSEVIIDGESVGFVYNKKDLVDLLEKIDRDTQDLLGGFAVIDRSVTYIPRIMPTSGFTAASALEQNIMRTQKHTTFAYGFYVNGELMCAAFTEDDANEVINKVKGAYLEEFGDCDSEEVIFLDDVVIKKQFVSNSYLRSPDGIIAMLSATKEGEVTYTVEAGDTLWQIAIDNEMDLDELYELNDSLADSMIYPGNEITLKKSIPLYSLVSHYKRVAVKDVPYDVEKIELSDKYVGYVEVVEAGELGSKLVDETVTKINGDVIQRLIHSEQSLTEPKRELIKVGTKPVPKKGNGIFARPLFGTITSRFGKRGGGYHTGLDIAAASGSLITAADSGVVIYAGWLGSYGNLVKIDHRNGYVTYYAHCSSILVSNGQEISKGQNIAKVGSTGNSTGPHLHFEVRVSGEPKNPDNYLN